MESDKPMAFIAPVAIPRIVRANRRANPRVPADQLQWLEDVRLTYGQSVSLIDLSARGAFFEVGCRLRAGDPTQLELVATRDRIVATGRILRSEVVAIETSRVLYRGACEFDAPLPWTNRLSAAAVGLDRTTLPTEHFEPWPHWSEIVAVFRHGRRLPGFMRAFDGSAGVLEVWPSRAAVLKERHVIPLSLLRAVHVIRDFAGDGRSLADGPERSGKWPYVEIAFTNGQVLRGTTPGHREDGAGLWVCTRGADPSTRVFAVSSAIAEIRVF
jgi:hypothetical protein